MSREFGSCRSGYFHNQIDIAASDCLNGKDKLTQLWGEFFNEFKGIAYAISSSEACDSGVDFPIIENLKKIDNLKEKLKQIEKYLDPYQRVFENAVKETIEKGLVEK